MRGHPLLGQLLVTTLISDVPVAHVLETWSTIVFLFCFVFGL